MLQLRILIDKICFVGIALIYNSMSNYLHRQLKLILKNISRDANIHQVFPVM